MDPSYVVCDFPVSDAEIFSDQAGSIPEIKVNGQYEKIRDESSSRMLIVIGGFKYSLPAVNFSAVSSEPSIAIL